MIVYCNVPAFKESLTNFKLLFQALVLDNYHTISLKPTRHLMTCLMDLLGY